MGRLAKNKFQIPDNLTPQKFVCFQLNVPDDETHIANFLGALGELSQGHSYPDDDNQSAKKLSQYWRKVLFGITFDKCDLPPNVTYSESEDALITRIVCEDDKAYFEVQVCACPETWLRLANANQVDGAQQQGGGAPQPDVGACQVYHAQFDAKSVYNVPTVVSAGDTLTFTKANGAGWDGGFGDVWHCPSGQTFFAGACVGVPGYASGDPASAEYHMQLVANIGGTWYPADEGTLTVPSGVSNAQVLIQVNDSTLTDNSGSYALDIEVCKAASTGWCYEIDLKLDPSYYSPVSIPYGVLGTWVAGRGWGYNDFSYDNATWRRGTIIEWTGAALPIGTKVTATYDLELGSISNPAEWAINAYNATGGPVTFADAVDGDGQIHVFTISNTSAHQWVLESDIGSSVGAFTGSIYLTKVKFENTTGTNPFGSSNC